MIFKNKKSNPCEGADDEILLWLRGNNLTIQRYWPQAELWDEYAPDPEKLYNIILLSEPLSGTDWAANPTRAYCSLDGEVIDLKDFWCGVNRVKANCLPNGKYLVYEGLHRADIARQHDLLIPVYVNRYAVARG